MEYRDNLKHHGILGMKWGVRRYQNKDGSLTPAGKKKYSGDTGSEKKEIGYQSKGIKAGMARRANKKVDAGFKKWDENAKKKESAISLGKKATADLLAYEKNKSDKTLKSDYKKSEKEYKKALKENTTYRKGAIRQEVGRDRSRKYLSEAKRVKQELLKDSSNKQLQKKYNDLMSSYNIERANARRAAEVGKKRSTKIASLKRARTLAIKGAVATASITAGTVAVNSYLKKNGHSGIDSDSFNSAVNAGKKLFNYADYIY